MAATTAPEPVRYEVLWGVEDVHRQTWIADAAESRSALSSATRLLLQFTAQHVQAGLFVNGTHQAGHNFREERGEEPVMTDKSAKRFGFATIEPYEAVVFDDTRHAEGLPPWRSESAGPGNELFYLDSEVHAMTADERALYDSRGMPR